ncbi:MAG: Rieske 2Fe-2S domain-containing protein [Hyphomonadaceae bacterium]
MSWLTDKLATLMSERGVTADSLAQKLAVERSRMRNIASGEAIPNESLTKRLAKFFDEDEAVWLDNVQKREDPKKAALESLPADFFKVATTSEIPDGEMKIVFHDLVAIANAEGQFYAFGNVCPHAAGPIGEGFLEGCIVECPWHAGRWDVRTGKALTLLATADVPCFEVRVVGEDIELRVTAAVAAQGEVSTAGPDPA